MRRCRTSSGSSTPTPSTLAALLLTAGSLADLLGRRLSSRSASVAFTAGSLLCGLATDPLFLDLARGVQGVGGAIMFATSLALIAHASAGRTAASRSASSAP
jgi:MFS family permease